MTQGKTINNTAAKFLEDRGFDMELMVREGIHSASPKGSKQPPAGQESGWVAIPSMQGGEQVGCKYRYTGDKRFMQDKGSKQILYRRDSLKGAKRIVLTEGEFDALSAVQAGFYASVSVPGGAPQEVGQKSHDYFNEAMDDILAADEIILAFDDDGPGHALFEDAKALFGPAKCKFIRYPKGCKDLNDVLAKKGPAVLSMVLENAQYVPVDGIYKPSDLPDLPDLQVFRTGLSDDFDKHIGICLRHTSVWTGYANHGKSMVIKQVMASLAVRYGWKMGVVSMEDDYQRNYKVDIARSMIRRPIASFDEHDWEKFNRIYENQWLLLQPPENEEVTLDWLFDRMETAVLRHGVKMLVIDPFTEIELRLKPGEQRHDVIGQALSAFNRFARRYNVHIAIIAHPKKPERGEAYPPTGYDVSGAAHWKNKPYLGVTVHRDPKLSDVNQIIVWKSKRRDPMGPTGTFYMAYSSDTSCLMPMTKGEYRMLSDGDIKF